MATTVATVISQLATLVQEDRSTYGGSDWSTNLWSVPEIIKYINAACKELVLQSQIVKVVAPVSAVVNQRIYADPTYTMQLDRIAFSGKATYRTTRLNLDRENPKWRTLSGIPRQYHQDQLSTKTFEFDRACTSAMVGSGYTGIGPYGVLRLMMHAPQSSVADAAITATQSLLTSATANWSVADVGKQIAVSGAGPGGQPLATTIAGWVSATQVTLSAVASVTVTNAVTYWAPFTFYSVTLPGSGGMYRYSIGTPPITATLLNYPYAGTLRQMFSGLTNFLVLGTRLMPDISSSSDIMHLPDFTLPYIKFWTLMQMLSKEGEAQDLPRAKYCKMRFDFGVQLLRRLISATHDKVTQPQGAPQ